MSLYEFLSNPLVDTPMKVAAIFLVLFGICILYLNYRLEQVKEENKRLKSKLTMSGGKKFVNDED
ncbi:hypothetical protein ACFLXX_05980 [Chloroflexota bacterium]